MGLKSWATGVFIRKAEADAEKEYPVIAKIHAWLNGKKTVIGAALVLLTEILNNIGSLATMLGADNVKVAHYVALGVTAVGLIHKGWKQLADWGVIEPPDPPVSSGTLNRLGGLVVLAILLLPGCALRGSRASVQLGGDPMPRPDPKVVMTWVCSAQESRAVAYLALPEFSWICQGGRERFYTDALDAKARGECPCPVSSCGSK